MKAITSFDELRSLEIGTFVQIKTSPTRNFIVIVCSPAILSARPKGDKNNDACLMTRDLPAGAMVMTSDGMVEFYAHAPGKAFLNQRIGRKEFEADGFRCKFYVLEPDEICDLFLRLHEMAQGADEVVRCLKENVDKLKKRLV